MNTPKLILVGAGPGDAELITLKALKAIQQADVILYDNLINLELLDYAKPKAEQIYVGKKGHEKGISQESINCLIIEKAYEKGTVVRLKGGDPYIFGRGGEEYRYAIERGLEVEYIPGISSIQTLGLNNIPLTDRVAGDGFWVITGHKSDKSLSTDLHLAAKSNATVVILMGMSKLPLIAEIFTENSKTLLPFAIIQHASTPNEKKVSGKVQDMLYLAQKNQLSNPAVIVIGEVVDCLKTSSKQFLLANQYQHLA